MPQNFIKIWACQFEKYKCHDIIYKSLFKICLICYTYFDSIKDNLYSHKNLDTVQEVIEFDEDAGQKLTLEPEEEIPELPTGKGRYDYIGILKVPSVGIERGFTAFDNPVSEIVSKIKNVINLT